MFNEDYTEWCDQQERDYLDEQQVADMEQVDIYYQQNLRIGVNDE